MEHAHITNELLHDLIAEPLSVIELCSRHALTVHELHDIIISPAFKHIADMIKVIQKTRRSFCLDRVTQVLERIAMTDPTTPAHAETVRKAAAQLDRELRQDAEQAEQEHDDQQPAEHESQHQTQPHDTSDPQTVHAQPDQHPPGHHQRTEAAVQQPEAAATSTHANAPPVHSG